MRIGKWEIRRADASEVRIPGDLQTLALHHGDVLVLNVKGHLSREQADALKANCNQFLLDRGAGMIVTTDDAAFIVKGKAQ